MGSYLKQYETFTACICGGLLGSWLLGSRLLGSWLLGSRLLGSRLLSSWLLSLLGSRLLCLLDLLDLLGLWLLCLLDLLWLLNLDNLVGSSSLTRCSGHLEGSLGDSTLEG